MKLSRAASQPIALSLAILWGCSRNGAAADAEFDATTSDSRTESEDSVAVDVSDISAIDASDPAPWPSSLEPSERWGTAGTLRYARVIAHAHSVHSHDACDNQPYTDGGPNEPCLQHFRAALCTARVDVVFLTEHSSKMAEGTFERVMQQRAGDEEVRENGALVGYWIACDAAHRTLVLPGAENELMPLALTRHPEPIAGASLVDTYRSATDEAIARFRAADGFVVVSHAEQKPRERVVAMRPDGVELYNLHANIDPRIATPFLAVNIGAELAEIWRFRSPSGRHTPDWFFLGIFRENAPDLLRLSDLWRDGQTVAGIAGSDAHENSIPALLADGERGDSYRRVFRWFSNAVMYRPPLSRTSIVEALRAARARVFFEAWGSPSGFSFTVRTDADASGAAVADGLTVSLRGGSVTLSVEPPALLDLPAGAPQPTIRVRLLRADERAASGWSNATEPSEASQQLPVDSPGIYRAEALITPHHARAYLPRLGEWIREVPWIYSAPIRIVGP